MKFVRWFPLVFIGLFLYLLVDQYLFCPQYSFPESKPFSGPEIFNPYENIDSSSWLQSNFHAHALAWKGLTDGKGTAAESWRIYDSLGYDVHCLSYYETVNRYGENEPNYIPAYEHGYSYGKNHHGVLGTFHVFYRDYIFPQTLSNKQHLLNCIHNDTNAFVIINHPMVRSAFPPDDFRYLSNYDAIEVMRGDNTYSLLQWDKALSSGKQVFIVNDDDSHDSKNPAEVGRNCTFINAPNDSASSILKALREGKAYGMVIPFDPKETLHEKILRFQKGFPKLISARVIGDTFKVSVSATASLFQYLGQDLRELQRSNNAKASWYIIKPADHYIRLQIAFPDGTTMFLNAVHRYDPSAPDQDFPQINKSKTFFYRILGALILLAYLFLVVIVNRRLYRTGRSSQLL